MIDGRLARGTADTTVGVRDDDIVGATLNDGNRGRIGKRTRASRAGPDIMERCGRTASHRRGQCSPPLADDNVGDRDNWVWVNRDRTRTTSTATIGVCDSDVVRPFDTHRDRGGIRKSQSPPAPSRRSSEIQPFQSRRRSTDPKCLRTGRGD